MTARLPRKNIQNVQFATILTNRRNDVGKALEPNTSPKPLNWRTPPLPIRPRWMNTNNIKLLKNLSVLSGAIHDMLLHTSAETMFSSLNL